MNPEEQKVPLIIFIKAVMKSIQFGSNIKISDWSSYLTEALATEAFEQEKTADKVFLRFIDALSTKEFTDLSTSLRQILKILEKNKIRPPTAEKAFSILDCLIINIYYNHFLANEIKDPLETSIALNIMAKPAFNFNAMKKFFKKNRKRLDLMRDVQGEILRVIQPTKYYWLDWADEARKRNIGPLKAK